jgi:hypothetical protein
MRELTLLTTPSSLPASFIRLMLMMLIMVGNEGLSRSATSNSVHHRSFNLNEITLFKVYGFQDKEQRFRQRYLDLIMNERSRDVLITRSKISSRFLGLVRPGKPTMPTISPLRRCSCCSSKGFPACTPFLRSTTASRTKSSVSASATWISL